MSTNRTRRGSTVAGSTSSRSYRFPREATRGVMPPDTARKVDDLRDTFSSMSRRIDDLARELHCLGWFDDDNDGPRAA